MANAETIAKIKRAQKTWQGCDWPHHLRTDDGLVFGADDAPIWCDGNEIECRYCTEAAEAAAIASGLGTQAIDALVRGDVKGAWEAVTQAGRIESEWGDDGIWGPIASLLTQAITDGDDRCVSS